MNNFVMIIDHYLRIIFSEVLFFLKNIKLNTHYVKRLLKIYVCIININFFKKINFCFLI